jgi:hypothetical protein
MMLTSYKWFLKTRDVNTSPNPFPNNAKLATFALTRGYKGFSKARYVFIVRRNRALRQLFHDSEIVHLLFHEGNISHIDQFLIRILSGLKLRFVDVSNVFTVNQNQIIPSGTQRDIGYRLMCRFQYRDVWQFLESFEYVYRVDEDCLVDSLPRPSEKLLFATGALSNETHETTNQTLYALLKQMHLEKFYDHLFPYTNCYLTQVSFWTRKDVQSFLELVGGNQRALVDRWGDLPILGVTLKAYGGWNAKESVNPNFSYRHLSHNARVRSGRVVEEKIPLLVRVMRKVALVARLVSGKNRP